MGARESEKRGKKDDESQSQKEKKNFGPQSLLSSTRSIFFLPGRGKIKDRGVTTECQEKGERRYGEEKRASNRACLAPALD